MFGADRSVVAVAETEDWHPRYWTLACVTIFHLVFVATLLTSTPIAVPPPTINAVDVVTFPDGVAEPSVPDVETPPVDLKQFAPDEVVPTPTPTMNPQLGPKPTDRRTQEEPPLSAEPRPLDPEPPVPVPASTPAPAVQPLRPALIPTPAPVIATPDSEPVPVKVAPSSPSLVPPDVQPLSITGSKLAVKQAAAVKPVRRIDVPLPPVSAPALVQTPTPTLDPTPTVPNPKVPSPAKAAPPSPAPRAPPPEFAVPRTAPLTIVRPQTALPKVQVPRIAATDLRLPELQVPASGALPLSVSAPAGVTSVTGGARYPTGALGRGGLPSSQSGGAAAPTSGPNGQGGSMPLSARPSGTDATGAAGGGGPTGMLPRRPGGASVRQPFPRGDTSTILGKMDKTYDCSRLNRERDERCPNWDPIEGRNGQGGTAFDVPVPKGLPKLRNPLGTNPLPVCPPGTPGNQMGLSCLPSREGPGIPKQ